MLIYLFMLHFIADFLLQSREMGKKKSIEFKWLLYHLSIQFSVFSIGILIKGDILSLRWILFPVLNTLIHGIIDWNIWKLYKLSVIKRFPEIIQAPEKFQYWEDHWFYTTIGFDQLLHSLTLIILWYLL